MSEIICPKCGATIPQESAFCGVCGAPLGAQQQAPPTAVTPPAGWQPPVASQPPPNAYPPQPPGAYTPPPPGAIPAGPGGYPVYPGAKVTGQNTKWALGLGIAALFCCGPFTAIPGFFMAKKDMDMIASGQAPHLNESSAKGAYYLNIIALILSVLGWLFVWSRGGLRGF